MAERLRGVRLRVALAGCALGVVLSSCGSSVVTSPSAPTTTSTVAPGTTPTTVGSPSGPWALSASPKLTLTVTGGCPPSVAGYQDVTNTYPGPPLVPDHPTAGLVCRYHPKLGVPSSDAGRLARRTELDGAEAQRLATVVRSLDLRPPRGAFSCPADDGGVVLIAFSYPSRPDVDLWYAASACQTLDNGRIGAFGASNPSFYRTFEGVINRLSAPISPN